MKFCIKIYEISVKFLIWVKHHYQASVWNLAPVVLNVWISKKIKLTKNGGNKTTQTNSCPKFQILQASINPQFTTNPPKQDTTSTNIKSNNSSNEIERKKKE